MHHDPVLLDESLDALDLAPGDRVVDATLGLGGHARAFLEAVGPQGRLLGIERSAQGLAEARRRLAAHEQQATLVHGDFRRLAEHIADAGIQPVQAAFFDLGLASWQVDEGHQGLSFAHDGPLDMRLGHQGEPLGQADDPSQWTDDRDLAHCVRTWRFKPASEFLARATQQDIERILRSLGGVRQATRVAAAIATARQSQPIMTTKDLVAAIGSDSPKLLAPTFQSLRILANDEYGALAAAIPAAWQSLAVGGRLALISFHGGEHRLVKQLLRALPNHSPVRKVVPSDGEVANNPRSRSAQLRVTRHEGIQQ